MSVATKKVVRRVVKTRRDYGDYGRTRPTKPGWYWVWTVGGPKVAEIRLFRSVDRDSLCVWCCAQTSLIGLDISDERIRRSTKIILWGPECPKPAAPSADDPMSKCLRCGGTGRVLNGRSYIECVRCDGAGFCWGT